jgi:hypothetical protein
MMYVVFPPVKIISCVLISETNKQWPTFFPPTLQVRLIKKIFPTVVNLNTLPKQLEQKKKISAYEN